jgi:hypothetical protein
MGGTEYTVASVGVDKLVLVLLFLFVLGNCVYAYIKKPSRMPAFVDGGQPFVFYVTTPQSARQRVQIPLCDVDWDMVQKWARGETVQISGVVFEHEYPPDKLREWCKAP